MKQIAFHFLISILLIQMNCSKTQERKKNDINDCDTIGNYYENGEHYIRRDLVTDDGVIDYSKMLDNYKGRNTNCNPLNN